MGSRPGVAVPAGLVAGEFRAQDERDDVVRVEALKTLAGFAVGKPVLIEETFPLACSPKELEGFIDGSRKHAAGWVGFYWGKPPEELRRSKAIPDALTLGWLELFERRAKALGK